MSLEAELIAVIQKAVEPRVGAALASLFAEVRLYTTTQVSELLNVDRATVPKLVKPVRFGNKNRFRHADVMAAIEEARCR